MKLRAQPLLHSALGELIKLSAGVNFRGKNSRLIPLWLSLRDTSQIATRALPGGGVVQCDFSVPYECMVWLRHEEEADLRVLTRLLKQGDTFVDCGANIGIWTLVAAAAVGHSGKVFAFEPNCRTAEKLTANVQSSGFQNVNITQAAVGEEVGTLNLKAEVAHNTSRIAEEDGGGITVSVPSVTLDKTLADIRIAGCKIDVEGFEYPVLKGAEEILKRDRPWLCVEFNAVISGAKNLGEWNVHKLLSNLGYAPRLFEDALKPLAYSRLSADFQTAGYCNIYYSPN